MWLLVLRVLPLLLAVRRGGAEESQCSGGYRANFVLDAEDSFKQGAVLLATTHTPSQEECERQCCLETLCNLALREPNGTCALFDCIYRNRFVCDRFQSSSRFLTFVTGNVYRTYLNAPPRKGEHRQPIAVGGLDQVVQPGETVVLSGIESHSPGDQIQDYTWSLIRGNSTVTMEKTEYPDQVRVSGLQPGTYLFQLKVTDSDENSATDKIVVVVLTPEQSGLFCLAPPKVGPCRASFTRWHYDGVSGVCKSFTYGGCRGNYNNYLSVEACEQACRGVTASSERKALPPVSEVCGTCCLRKSLECDGVKQCRDGADENDCSKLNQTFNQLRIIKVDQKKVRCTLPPRTGPCRASFTRWFYDPRIKKCDSFTFGGCEANENNHEDEDKCNEYCSGITVEDVYSPEMFKRFQDEEEETKSGSVALAVVLTVALLALLAVAAYCFLRRKKDHGHVPVSPTDDKD